MARATLKLKHPITDFDVDIEENSLEVLGYIKERKGHWYDKGSLSCRCSECGCKSPQEFKYCPNCGAKMEME